MLTRHDLSLPLMAVTLAAGLLLASAAAPDGLRSAAEPSRGAVQDSPGSRGRADTPSAGLTVFPTHPRLIIGGYRGVTVTELRMACQRPELREQCAQIGGRHILDDAMRWLLVEDRGAADKVATELRAWTGCSADDVGVEHIGWGGLALAYDWTWDALPSDVRRQTEDNLFYCGQAIATALEGNGPHLWHGYTSLAAAMALMTLGCDRCAGDQPSLDNAQTLFRGNALEAYAVVGGAWPEGYNYERSHFFSADPPDQFVIDALRAWDSAVERDHPDHASIFETIAVEEGDWLRGLAYHLVYGTLDPVGPGGKYSLMRGGDMPTGQAWPNKQYRPFVDSIARVYADGVLAAWGEQIALNWPFVGGDGTYHSIHRYSLPYNLPLNVTSTSPFGLPWARIWGRDDLGYAITRSSFGMGATVIGYRAGKWFTGHQHMDQGHIDIWRKGPLAVDAGVYAEWGSEHREAYYMRTVAHNTLLIHRDGEDFEEHPGSGVKVNDDGQRVHTYNRRGCAQCMQSVTEWRANLGAGMHFEAGQIDAYENGPDYTVIASDLTAAYNSTTYSTPGNTPKVESVQRDLIYIRPDRLLVFDRVITTPGSGPPRFALHLPAKPELSEPTIVAGSADNGILKSPVAAFQIDNGSGGLLKGTTLAPPDANLTAIGGPDYRYWVDGKNRSGGAAAHEGAPAEPGLWRIEAAPRSATTTTLLVNALTITDSVSAVDTRSRARLLAAHTPSAPPALAVIWDRSFGPWLVVASAAVPRRALQFTTIRLPDDLSRPLHLLVTDLHPRPGESIRIAIDGSPVAAPPASAEGVLSLIVPSGQDLSIGLCPPIIGSDPAWQILCGQAAPTPTAIPLSRLYLPKADVIRNR
jgi:hypothetical protein